VSDFEGLVARLDQIAEELDDLAFEQLREAVSNGELERPRSDKTVMQARRAIAKAAHLLRSIEG